MRDWQVAALALALAACGGRTLAGDDGTFTGGGGSGASGGTGGSHEGGSGGVVYRGGSGGIVYRGGSGGVVYGGGTSGLGGAGGIPDCVYLLSDTKQIMATELHGVVEGTSFETWHFDSLTDVMEDSASSFAASLVRYYASDAGGALYELPPPYLDPVSIWYPGISGFGMGVVREPGTVGTLYAVWDRALFTLNGATLDDPQPLPGYIEDGAELADSDANGFFVLTKAAQGRLAITDVVTGTRQNIDALNSVTGWDLVHALEHVIVFTGEGSTTAVQVLDDATLELLWSVPDAFPFLTVGAGISSCRFELGN